MADEITDLRGIMRDLPDGPVINPDPVEAALARAWDQISGTETESTKASKLCGRTELMAWAKPVLSFVIERHGGTVLGSSRAALHKWMVNLDTLIAECDPRYSHRQLIPMAPRLDVRPLARDLADIIVHQRDDPRVRWREPGRMVQVNIALLIPDNAANETTTKRRQRFRKHLEPLLAPQGWLLAVGKAWNTYVLSLEELR